mgnify:CR=1 FL=1
MSLLKKLKGHRDAINDASGNKASETQQKLDKVFNLNDKKLKGKYGQPFNGNIN